MDDNFYKNLKIRMFDGGKVVLTDVCAKKKADDLATAGPSTSLGVEESCSRVLPRITEVMEGKFLSPRSICKFQEETAETSKRRKKIEEEFDRAEENLLEIQRGISLLAKPVEGSESRPPPTVSLPLEAMVESDDKEEVIDVSSEKSSYSPPSHYKSKVRAIKPKRGRGRPPTTEEYVGLVKAKKAAARAEERLQRARLDNLAALGKLPSKSLQEDILEPENLEEARKHMSSQLSSALVDQVDAALRNIVHVSDNRQITSRAITYGP